MRRLPLLPSLLALASLAAAEPAPPLLKSGDFALATGWNLGGGAAIEADSGNPVLVLRGDPAKGVSAVQELACEPAWGVLRFRYRVNVSAITPGKEGWHNARIALTVTDRAGKVHHLAAGEWSQPTTGWVAAEKLIVLPEGAASVKVSPAIFNAAGEMRLDDLVVELAARRGEGVDVQPPADQRPQWGQEPVEAHGPARGAVCLNGVWRFMPAHGPAAEAPQATGWGWQRVPGSWRPGSLPGKLADGSGPAWEGWNGDRPAAWYERELAVPAAWAGRAIVLDLQRVSTDAAVFIDGKEAGRVSWPDGEVDLTAAVRPGATHRLRIKVVAVAEAGEVTRFMGMGEGQVLKEKAVLATRGLIGDVLLTSRPRGAHLSGCAIATSVRERTLTVSAEYAGLAAAGALELTAVVREATSGREVKRFTARLPAAAGDGAVQAAWGWDDPLLWDIDQPNLYTLELAARGAGLNDCLVERFGFREFRIDGKRFLLNEREIRLRPAPIHAESGTAGVREHIAGTLDGLRWAGFNTYEMWPWDRHERGAWAFDELWCREADQRGILLITPALDMTRLAGEWDKPGVASTWERAMAGELRRLRNHPATVMWVTGANRFGHSQDQSPAVIGRRGDPADQPYRRVAGFGRDAIARIKQVDPTRPVFMHAGAAVGDVFTANNYLCLTPLQEREEWPSRWAADGDLPVLMVEFGTPLFTSFHRGRRGYGEAVVSEPLYTEFCAIYQGAEAYRLEGADYRTTLAATFERDQAWKSWHAIEVPRMHPGF
ncbi:MAG: hypothetical protein L6R48_23405, partial [Planctomycetes bacterium]|nr:hypothetical protein [Planctomycetota bacterium]